MKMLAVFLTLLVFCLAFLIAVDLISGIAFPEAIRILAQSFSVVTVQEKVIVFVAVIIPLLIPFINNFSKKKKAKTK